MIIILAAFSLFHFFLGAACLGVAVRLLTPGERALWRSQSALLMAEMLCWIYPIAALVGVLSAWRAHQAGEAHALALIAAPLLVLAVMGLIYAIIDFAEDGIIGNARNRESD